jgi:DNA-binding Lrp family transcriptional regulator
MIEVLANYEGSYETFGDRLRAVEGVSQVYFTMGETDFIVVAHLPSSDSVERLISEFEAIEGVERTNSTFVIDTLQDSTRVLESYGLETLVEELADE